MVGRWQLAGCFMLRFNFPREFGKMVGLDVILTKKQKTLLMFTVSNARINLDQKKNARIN